MATAADSLSTEVNVPLRDVVGNRELALEVVPETLRPGALDLPVRWAHVSELQDPAPYLLGGELILTAGVNLPERIDGYVRGLRDAGVTALGFGLTPSVHETLPESLRRACARRGLPLLVVPSRTPFLAVNRAVSVALTEAGQRDQRRITAARETLTRAAGGGLGELTSALADVLRSWVALVGAGDVLASAHDAPVPLPPEVRELMATVRAGSGIRSATTETDGGFVVVQPVYPQATASHLVVVGRRARLDGAERTILAVGAALLGLVGRAGSDAAELGAAATGLLLGRTSPGEVARALLGADVVRLVAGAAYRRGPDEVAQRADWLRARLDTPLVSVRPGTFVAVAGSVPRLEDLRAHGWLAAVGSPVPAAQAASAGAEVELLLARALALGRPVVAGSEPLDFEALLDPGASRGFASRALAPLVALDEAGDRSLVLTLRTWLAHHGGWEPTAAELGVHRNSVRHRIAQVERALDVDLADPETRMRLWFALRWMAQGP
ncbi:DNA-binding transcriptional regulator, PucR family [Amycolatopsis tolypomycina]|uniref:DNA-binding transcriptional regulator, PucR family n=1 Tax=Amycolatopsis tolypomycina TaxID=208445 RepID=A0A1H4RMQ6_9PSEU|nr:PucR family transcriptional regulator [Amycolatopsis tolypomycina]SEC33192.1 DNA-binding transcriptional regulator, PucR family [Amycolatopsis tolypomycina]